MSNNEKRVISKSIISGLLGLNFLLFILTTIIPGINKENFYSLLTSDKTNVVIRVVILALYVVSIVISLIAIFRYIKDNKLMFYGCFCFNVIVALCVLVLDLHFTIFTTVIRIFLFASIGVMIGGFAYFVYLAKKDYECLFGVNPPEEVTSNVAETNVEQVKENDNNENITNEESNDVKPEEIQENNMENPNGENIEETQDKKEKKGLFKLFKKKNKKVEEEVPANVEVSNNEVVEQPNEAIQENQVNEEVIQDQEEIKQEEVVQETTPEVKQEEVVNVEPVPEANNNTVPNEVKLEENDAKPTKKGTKGKTKKDDSDDKKGKGKKKSSKKTSLFAVEEPVESQKLTEDDLLDEEAKKQLIKDIKNDISAVADENDIKVGIGKQKDFKKYFVTLIVSILALIGSYFAPIFIGEKTTLYPYYEFTKNKSVPTLILTIVYAIAIAIVLFSFGWLVVRRKEREEFENRVRNITTFIFVFSLLYFAYGLANFLINVLGGSDKGNTFAFIFPLVMLVVIIINSIIKSKYQKDILIVDTKPTIDYSNPNVDSEEERQIKALKRPFPNKGLLFADIIFTLLPVGCLFIDLFKISATNLETQTIRALDYITKFNQLTEPGYRAISFILVVSGIILVMFMAFYLATFFGRQKKFYSISTASIIASVVIVTFISLYGLYYKIVQANNKSQIILLIGQFVPEVVIETLDSYTVETYSYIMFIAAVVLLLVVLIINPMKDSVIYDELDDRDLLEARLNATPINSETLGEFVENRLGDRLNNNQPTDLANIPQLPIEEQTEENKEEQEEEVPEEVVEVLEDFDACPAFSELDSKAEEYNLALEKRNSTKFENLDLIKLSHFIINYAANSRLHLSYKYEDIAAFIAGLGCAKLTILQGMSGTGKTSLPKIFMEAIFGNCEIIEIESSWREKNELLGFYNEFSKMYTPKKFTQCLYKATLNKDVLTFIVLDEMNLSRIEYYFSDFLSLMENEEDKREIKLSNVKLYNIYDNERHSYVSLKEDHTLKVPANVWFIGTANRDESTFEISDKVYDRAHTMNFNKRAPAIDKYGPEMKPKFMDYKSFKGILDGAKKTYKFDIEKNDTIKKVEQLLIPFNISFGNRIYRQIIDFVKVYCSCYPDGKKVEFDAVETILLTKVVMKLENKNIENKELLVHEFEKLKLKRCAEFISKLSED